MSWREGPEADQDREDNGLCEGENPDQTVADMSQLLDAVAHTAGRFTLKICGDVLISALLKAGY